MERDKDGRGSGAFPRSGEEGEIIEVLTVGVSGDVGGGRSNSREIGGAELLGVVSMDAPEPRSPSSSSSKS